MIPELLDDLRRDEGWRDQAYRDSLGYLSIGYGFLIDERRRGRLPRNVGEYWLEVAARERWDALHAALPWLRYQPDDVQRALGNMAYQMGVEGVLGFKKMLAALEAGEREKAAKEAINSLWAAQTPERAARVAALIRGRV